MARRLLTLWIFPLCLLLAQAGAMAHGLRHAPDDAAGKDRVATADACVQCAGFAKLSHAATATLHDRGLLPMGLIAHGDVPYAFLAVATATFQPRGPPRFL